MSLTKKTLNFTPRAVAALNVLKAEYDANDTDMVNRAIVLGAVLIPYMQDGYLEILDSEGEVIRLILL